MASITQQASGRWRAIVHRRKMNIYRSKTFRTKAQAERWAREVEHKIDNGEFADRTAAENMTLAEALDRYVETVSPKKKGRGLIENRKQARNIKAHGIAKLPLARIKPADVIRYRDKRLEKVGPNTVRLELALISHLYTIAARDWGMDYLSNPVVRGVRPSVKECARDRRLQPGEEEILMNACEEYGGDIPDIVALAIETAMRRAELADLRWPNVNLRNRTAKLEDTKNGESRIVPLSSRAVEILERRAKVRDIKDDRVFQMTADAITKAFVRVCKAAGIEDLRFHDLRHEATSRLFERGLNPMQVASITGHKTLQMLKRYTHLRAEDLVELLG